MKNTIMDQQLEIFARAWATYAKQNANNIKAHHAVPIAKCQARYYVVPVGVSMAAFFLESYDTIVAAIVPFGTRFYCVNFMHLAYHFDKYQTGRTTTQHVHKFMKLIAPDGNIDYYRIKRAS